MTAKTATAEPPLYSITRCGDEPATDQPNTAAAKTEPAAGRMSPWRRAAIAAALATAPAPVIATAATGRAGWTTIVLIADIATILTAVIGHARAEETQWQPEPALDVTYTDAYGNRITHRIIPAERESS